MGFAGVLACRCCGGRGEDDGLRDDDADPVPLGAKLTRSVLEFIDPRLEDDVDGPGEESFLDDDVDRGRACFMNGAAGGRRGMSVMKSGKGGTAGIYWRLGLLPDQLA